MEAGSASFGNYEPQDGVEATWQNPHACMKIKWVSKQSILWDWLISLRVAKTKSKLFPDTLPRGKGAPGCLPVRLHRIMLALAMVPLKHF